MKNKNNIAFVLFVIMIFVFVLSVSSSFAAEVAPPEPYGPVPSENQLRWHEMEFFAFTHFNIDTFTGREWGLGNESESLFNPTQFDARQWLKVLKDAGIKGIIITAKHHDGF